MSLADCDDEAARVIRPEKVSLWLHAAADTIFDGPVALIIDPPREH